MYIKVKRILGFVASIVIMLLFAIPMFVIAICIKLDSKGPIIYKQKRIGKNGKLFNIYKFRTMYTKEERNRKQLTHEQMVTRVGKFLRKTSLDELPQLINVLKGEMSFIGPRPWVKEYYIYFTDKQKQRCNVLPGITGLAQIKGRNGINIFKKIEYDIEYVNNMNFWLDIKIAFETLRTVRDEKNAEISEVGIKEEISELKQNKKEVEKNKETIPNAVRKLKDIPKEIGEYAYREVI